MLVHKDRLTGTTSSGALTLTSSRFCGVLCSQIMVAPATSSTTYDLSITDSDSDTVFDDFNVEGTLLREVRIPMSGVYTITISNASADEAFVVKFGTEEN